MRSTICKILFCLLVNITVCICVASGTAGETWTFDQKLSPPKIFSTGGTESTFEKQFRKDTGESSSTRRVEFERTVPLGAAFSKNTLHFKFSLSEWPADLRPLARMWVAVGATNTISAEGTLSLAFSQGNVGMATELNDTYNVDGTMVLGCDFSVKAGEVIVEIENRTHLADIHCSIHTCVYVPGKLDSAASERHP